MTQVETEAFLLAKIADCRTLAARDADPVAADAYRAMGDEFEQRAAEAGVRPVPPDRKRPAPVLLVR